MTARRGSLRRRVAVLVAGSVAVAVVLVAVLTWLVVSSQVRASLDTALDREATRVQRLVRVDADWTGEGSEQCRYAAEPACVRLVETADEVGSGTGPLQTTEAALAVARGDQLRARWTAGPVRVVAVPTRPGEAALVGVPTRQADLALARTAVALTATGGVGVVLAGLLGWAAATVGLRPVRRLDEAVRRVRDSADPHDHVDLASTSPDDELGRLAVAVDSMLVELAAADDAQRAFVADASHELRTPLTTLRTNVQLLTADRPLRPGTRAALGAALGEEVAAMTRTVDDLVELAGDDRPRTAELVVEDVVAAARAAVAATSRRAPGVEVRTDLPGAPVGVRVPAGRLGRLLDVVLDNAVKYGAGGAVEVRVVSGTPGDGVVVVTVTDHGVGIPADERERVFDRFHRAPAARGLPGSGLGLAIAAQVVARAGGTITAEARADGGAGTTIRLVLPAG